MKTIDRTIPIALALACLAGSALAQNQPIRIGVVTPLSGTYAGIGQQVKWGLDLAARQINAAGGVAGRPLELIYEDEEANPAVAVQKAEKLFQVNKVDFLTGTVNSGSTLAVGIGSVEPAISAASGARPTHCSSSPSTATGLKAT